MHHLRGVRLLTALALVIPASLATWAVAGPASAVTGATCTGFTGAVTGVFTLSGCTDKANTGGSGKFVANTKKSPYSAVITWKGTGTTTTSLKYSSPAKSLCPTGQTYLLITGTVTGGTKAAIKSIPKKSAVSAKACYNAKAKPAQAVTLVKGQLFHI